MAKNSREKVAKMVAESYDGRVDILGKYWSRQTPILVYCHECNEAFRQRAESLFRGRRTRCRCEWEKPQPLACRRAAGHQVVHEWELSTEMFFKIKNLSQPSKKERK